LCPPRTGTRPPPLILTSPCPYTPYRRNCLGGYFSHPGQAQGPLPSSSPLPVPTHTVESKKLTTHSSLGTKLPANSVVPPMIEYRTLRMSVFHLVRLVTETSGTVYLRLSTASSGANFNEQLS